MSAMRGEGHDVPLTPDLVHQAGAAQVGAVQSTPRPADDAGASEAHAAVRNAFKLGASLLATWGIALVVRIILPRYLGPEQFGPINFADAFTTLVFIITGLGLETYVRKEIPVRPEHASDFLGGIVLVRLVLSAAAFAVIAVVMHVSGRPAQVRYVVYLFAASQFFLTHNTTLAALLQAKGNVDGLSVVSVAGKLLWGAMILSAIVFGAGLLWIASAFVASEIVKTVALTRLAKKHLALRFSWTIKPAFPVIRASLPFFINAMAITAYARLGVSVLAFKLGNDSEVGWFGAASNLMLVAMMMSPLITWVLTPLLARAVARSEDEMNHTLRRATEMILLIAIPSALIAALGADLWVRILFGEAFAPTAMTFRVLAIQISVSYVAVVSATALVLLNRGWTLTLVSIVGLAFNLTLNLLLVRPVATALGPGGGGVAVATTSVLTEVLVMTLMLVALRWRGFQRRTVAMLGRALAACAAVVVLDRLIVGRTPVPVRLAIDVAAYAALSLLLLGSRWREGAEFFRVALRRPQLARQAS